MEKFLEISKNQLEIIYDKINSCKELKAEDLDKNKTALCIVDLINGFAKKGNLYSENLEKIIPLVNTACKYFQGNNMEIIAYKDKHEEDSVEFQAYLPHCIYGTEEINLVDELKEFTIKEIYKNSTNGFLAKNPLEILENKEITDFVIVGGCTDICVYQFAITLKAYFNEINKKSRIIVPMDMVDTFDLNFHRDAFYNMVFLDSMINNGIEVVKTIKF